MTPVDLRVAPPRAPRETLHGVTFLPRSIDKICASLPGGHLGEYALRGLTTTMFETLGVTVSDAAALVRDAQSEAEIADGIRALARSDGYARWEADIRSREPLRGDRSAALLVYPWLVERPDLVLVLDVLEEDDRRLFGAPRGTR